MLDETVALRAQVTAQEERIRELLENNTLQIEKRREAEKIVFEAALHAGTIGVFVGGFASAALVLWGIGIGK